MLTSTINEVELSNREFDRISDLVYKHCGINLHEGKKELVRSRLAKRLRALKLDSFDGYLDFATKEGNADEFTQLIDSISTNLTSFFREKQHFDYLSDTFFPALLSRKQASGDNRIRAWSAGCSSGEEAYTISITIKEAIQGNSRWDAKVLATDISTRVLKVAKEGVYDKKRIDPVPPEQKHKYLVRKKGGVGDMYEVSDALKSMVYFAQLNLMGEWPIKTKLDFIFCRNVMIYFDKSTQQRLVNRFYDRLDSGGVLFTGHSESLTGIEHRFKYVKPTIYMKP